MNLREAERIWNKGPGEHNPRWQEALDWLLAWHQGRVGSPTEEAS